MLVDRPNLLYLLWVGAMKLLVGNSTNTTPNWKPVCFVSGQGVFRSIHVPIKHDSSLLIKQIIAMSDNLPETADTEELAPIDRQISHQPNSSPRQDHLVAQRIIHNMEEKPVEASSGNGTPAVVAPPNETDVGFGKLTSSQHKDSTEINKPYDPVRTIPLRSLDTKRRRLDRLTDETVPEVHIVGQLTYGKRLTHEISEGAFCRYYLIEVVSS